MRYAVCPMILHSEPPPSSEQFYVPKVYQYGASFMTISQSAPDGKPTRSWALVALDENAAGYRAADANADTAVTFLDGLLDEPLGPRASSIRNALSSKYGITVTITSTTTMRQLLTMVGLQLHPAFDLARLRA